MLFVIILLAFSTRQASAKPKLDTFVSGTIAADTTWNLAGSPYLVNGDLSINPGVTLTIDPGVIVKFYGEVSLAVYGTLDVNGEDGSPVIITEIRDDVGGDSNGDGNGTLPAPGGWRGIYVADNGNAHFDYAEIYYGGGYFYIHPWWANHYGNLRKDGTGTLSINHSLITLSAGCGLNFNNTSAVHTVQNNIFSNNLAYGVCLGNSSNAITLTGNTFTTNQPYSILTDPQSSGFGVNLTNILDRPIRVTTGTLDVSRTWSRQVYLVEPMDVTSAGVLNIPAGAVVKFVGDSSLIVNGTLNVTGESGTLVIFTSEADDSAGGDSNGDGSSTTPGPGNWRGIYVPNGGNITLDYAEIRYGGGYFYMNSSWGNHYGNLRKEGAGILSINHSVITRSGACGLGLYTTTGVLTISNSLFSNNLNYGACLSNAVDTITFSVSTFSGNTPHSIYTTPDSSGFAIPTSNILDKAIYVGGGNLTVNSTWSPQVYVSSTVYINSGSTLTIPAGAIVKFEGDQALEVYGTIDVNGEDGSPVIITEIRDDVGGDSNGDGSSTVPAAGGWRGIYVADFGNASLDYAELKYGGGNFYINPSWGNHYGNLRKDANGILSINHSLITQSAGCGVDFNNSTGVHSVSNTVFSSNQQYGVCLHNATDTISFSASTFTGNTPYSIYTTPHSSGFSIPSDNILERGIYVDSGAVDTNSTWSRQVYLVNTVTVNSGFTLTLPAGAIVKMFAEQSLQVNGTLAVNGADGMPVIITEIRDDTGGDSNGDGTGTVPAAGGWRGVFVAENGSASLDYAEIRYGGGYFYMGGWGNHYGNLRKDGDGTLTINHSVITKSGECGLKFFGTVTSSVISNSRFFDNLYSGLYANTSGSNITIQTTLLDHNNNAGIELQNPGGITHIFSNTIVANTGTGIWLGSGTDAVFGDLDTNGNNVYGNTFLQLQNASTIALEASNNWWGINPPDYAGIAGNVDASSPLSAPAINAPAYLADLILSGAGFPAEVLVGEEMAFPLQIANNGPREAYYVKVSASLPVGVSMTGFSGIGWTCNQAGEEVTCVLPYLATDEESNLELVLVSPQPVHLDFDFILSQANNDEYPESNILSVDTQVNTRIFLPLVQK